MMSSFHIRRTLLGMSILGVVVVAVPLSVGAAQTVKIGVSGPLTGGSASNGKDIENGVRMAIDEANAQHMSIGSEVVQFVLSSVDDQGDPRVGVQVAQKL